MGWVYNILCLENMTYHPHESVLQFSLFSFQKVFIVISRPNELPRNEGRAPLHCKQFLGALIDRSKNFGSAFYAEVDGLMF